MKSGGSACIQPDVLWNLRLRIRMFGHRWAFEIDVKGTRNGQSGLRSRIALPRNAAQRFGTKAASTAGRGNRESRRGVAAKRRRRRTDDDGGRGSETFFNEEILQKQLRRVRELSYFPSSFADTTRSSERGIVRPVGRLLHRDCF